MHAVRKPLFSSEIMWNLLQGYCDDNPGLLLKGYVVFCVWVHLSIHEESDKISQTLFICYNVLCITVMYSTV